MISFLVSTFSKGLVEESAYVAANLRASYDYPWSSLLSLFGFCTVSDQAKRTHFLDEASSFRVFPACFDLTDAKSRTIANPSLLHYENKTRSYDPRNHHSLAVSFL